MALLFRTLLTLSMTITSLATADEISLVQGVFKNRASPGGFRESTLSAGGRYSQPWDDNIFWYGEAQLGFRTYSGGGELTPSDSTSIKVGGGARYYFDHYSDRVIPFAMGRVHLARLRDAESGRGFQGLTERTETGIFYGSDLGVRFSLNDDFFVDIETEVFTSALYSKESNEISRVSQRGIRESKNARGSRSELAFNTSNAFTSMILVIGMRL